VVIPVRDFLLTAGVDWSLGVRPIRVQMTSVSSSSPRAIAHRSETRHRLVDSLALLCNKLVDFGVVIPGGVGTWTFTEHPIRPAGAAIRHFRPKCLRIIADSVQVRVAWTHLATSKISGACILHPEGETRRIES